MATRVATVIQLQHCSAQPRGDLDLGDKVATGPM